MKVYAICFDGEPRVYCKTKELATTALSIKKNAIKNRLVTIVNDTEERFSFYFGWEGTGGTWSVKTLEVCDEILVVKHMLGE